MKRKISVAAGLAVAVLLVFAGLGHLAHPVKAQGGPSVLSRVGGNYFAPAYANWGAYILSGNSATGSQTITVCPAQAALPDGRVFNPFGNQNGTFAPITVDPQGSVAETVTPTAVSVIAAPAGASGAQQCANVTATFSNTHGASYSTSQVISGDGGIQEALNDAAANGGGQVYWEKDCGAVTLNTGGVTTTTTCNIPKTFTNLGGSSRTTTTITVATSFSVGISGATASFVSACTSLTAGQDCSQFQVSPTKVSQGAGLGAMLITAAGGTPGAGVVHPKVWGYTEVQSNF
jgi:hypothetical protein